MSYDFRRFEAFEVPLQRGNIVNASAGTGKTYAITSLVIRLIVERELPIDRILVVTFTEAATAELRSRIRTRVRGAVDAFRLCALQCAEKSGDIELDKFAVRYQRRHSPSEFLEAGQRLEQALADIDQAAISTIHGFCFRMLQQSAFETGAAFECEMAKQQRSLIDQVLDDFWAISLHEFSLPRARLLLLDNKGISRAALRPLVEAALSNPDLTLLPLEPPNPEAPSENDFTEAYRQARDAWDQNAVLDCLASSSELKGKHRPAKKEREKWCTEVEAYFQPKNKTVHAMQAAPTGLSKITEEWLCRKGALLPAHPYFSTIGALKARLDLQNAHDAAQPLLFKRRLLEYARQQYPARKHRSNLLSFDDLLVLLRDALEAEQGQRLVQVMRKQYQAALIDEFQDTDPVQFAIFHKVYHGSALPIFMIGDPKQAIYAFRGADVFAYLKALKETQGRRYTMSVNWRSDPLLLAAINQLFRSHAEQPQPFILEGIDYLPINPRPAAKNVFKAGAPFSPSPLEILFVGRADAKDEVLTDKPSFKTALPAIVASDIARLLRGSSTINGRELSPKDIAVLTRSNDQCFDIQNELRALQIPAVVLGDQSVFISQEAGELSLVLGAILEPTQASMLRSALATDLIGLGALDLEELESEPLKWDRWAMQFRRWHHEWADKGFIQMFRSLLAESGSPERLLQWVDGERRMTNLLHLMELLHLTARESQMGPSALLAWLTQERHNAERKIASTAEHTEIRLESDAEAVKLTTIHKSKGLEFPIVYCPYLWDGSLLFSNEKAYPKFHDTENGGLSLDLGSSEKKPHIEQAEREALAENMRLLYVALTRAKHRCTIVWGGVKDFGKSALSLLLDPPTRYPLELTEIKDRHKKLSDYALLEMLEEHCNAGEGAAGIRPYNPNLKVPSAASAPVSLPLAPPRSLTRKLEGFWRTASFSSLTHAAHEMSNARGSTAVLAPQALPERDCDEWDAINLATGRPATLNWKTETPTSPPSTLETSLREQDITLNDFPRGATAGTCFHDILEHIDFTASLSSQTSAIDAALRSHGFEPEKYREVVLQALSEILATPLGGPAGDFTLSKLTKSRRLNEMEFHLPVAVTPGATTSPELTGTALGSIFSEHPSDSIPLEYHQQLSMLDFTPLQGFLKGFVDLIFEHEGRYFVVDYKTNHLGNTLGDYHDAAMRDAMAHSHYYLQYHLYSVALHRFLKRRLPAYRYEEHFGGCYYLFLKGMHPKSGSHLGVFHERPPEGRLTALDQLFARSAAEAAT